MERPWCARPDGETCACFGTVTPSTGMRDPRNETLTVPCAHFTPDGGKTPTLREMR